MRTEVVGATVEEEWKRVAVVSRVEEANDVLGMVVNDTLEVNGVTGRHTMLDARSDTSALLLSSAKSAITRTFCAIELAITTSSAALISLPTPIAYTSAMLCSSAADVCSTFAVSCVCPSVITTTTAAPPR